MSKFAFCFIPHFLKLKRKIEDCYALEKQAIPTQRRMEKSKNKSFVNFAQKRGSKP